MKTELGAGWRWLLGVVLGVLGFSGCEELGMFKDMYGSPHADYKLVGDVKDTKGNPIQGIRVVFDRNPIDVQSRKDTLYTDLNGHFEKDRVQTDFWRTNSVVRFDDVDGSVNGSFRSKVLTHDEMTSEKTKKGDGDWYGGEYTVHADAVLEEDK